MNEQGTDLLTQAWEQIEVESPPTAAVIAKGRRLRRRRTALAAGVVAVVAAVPIAVSVVTSAETSQEPPQPPAASNTPGQPAVPGPTRVVASGSVAVTVPKSWVNLQPFCFPAKTDHVFFESHVVINCPAMPTSPLPPETDSLYVTALSTDRDAARALQPATTDDGLKVLESPVSCSDGMCEQSVAVESHDALFTVHVFDDQRELLDSIVSSVTVLPEGHVGVPYIDPGTSPAKADRIMQQAGLVFSADPALLDYLDLRLRPEAGSVVPVGTTVTAHLDD